MPATTVCSACGAVRRNRDVAKVNDAAFCHGEMDEYPTCYQIEVMGADDGR